MGIPLPVAVWPPEATLRVSFMESCTIIRRNTSQITLVTVLTDEQKAAFQKVAEDTVYKTAAETYGQELIDMAANHNK